MRSSDSPLDQPQPLLNRILTWAAVIMIVLTVPLVLGFVGRLQAEAKVTEEVQRRTVWVQKGEQTYKELQQAVDYAKTSAFTERYAREQARYARRGEVVVVPPSAQDAQRSHRVWWQDFVKLDSNLAVSDTIR